MFSFGTGTGQIELGNDLSFEDSQAIFASFGRAIYVASVLEYAMLNALFLETIVPQLDKFDNADDWMSAFDSHFEQGFQEGFGALVRKVCNQNILDKDGVEVLDKCRLNRNHLVHRFMREQSEFLYSVQGRSGIIEACENSFALFETARGLIENYASAQFARLGIDQTKWDGKVDAGMKELIVAGRAN